jgi:hypothetical protein
MAVLNALSQKWAQLGSQSNFEGSQWKPIEINNTDRCCEPQPTTNFPDGLISEKQRDRVLEVSKWLAEGISPTPETFLSRLSLAIVSLKSPQTRIWLWKALIPERKDPITVQPCLSPYSQGLSMP